MLKNNSDLASLKAAWLTSPVVPQKAKKVLSEMTKRDLESAFMGSLSFGTSGIRALMGPGDARLNIVTIRRITVGFVNYLQSKHSNLKKLQILVGCDNRKNSAFFLETIVTVLTSYGIQVLTYQNNELFPVPVLSYLIRKLCLTGAIMITASHNPKEYNGYKVYGPTGAQLLGDDITELANKISTVPDLLTTTFTYQPENHQRIQTTEIDEYLQKVSVLAYNTNVHNKDKLRFVYTPLSGTGYRIIPKLLRMNGYDPLIVSDQSYPDPLFEHVSNPNPENFAAFDKAVVCAKENNAQLLLASDPDADRLGVVVKHKGQWRHFNGNEMGILFLHYLTTTKQLLPNSYLVRTYVSTDLVDRIAARYQLKVVVCPTGFKWIGAMMNKTTGHFVLGFEEAVGATLLPLGRDKSSLESALLTCEMVAYYQQQNQSLVDVLEAVFEEYGFLYSATVARTFSLTTNWQVTTQRIFRFLRTCKLKMVDNLKIIRKTYVAEGAIILWFFEDGSWCAFRISGTEPKLKYYVHAAGHNLGAAQSRFEEIKVALDRIVDSQC